MKYSYKVLTLSWGGGGRICLVFFFRCIEIEVYIRETLIFLFGLSVIFFQFYRFWKLKNPEWFRLFDFKFTWADVQRSTVRQVCDHSTQALECVSFQLLYFRFWSHFLISASLNKQAAKANFLGSWQEGFDCPSSLKESSAQVPDWLAA